MLRVRAQLKVADLLGFGFMNLPSTASAHASCESGGPIVKAPARNGFGSTVIGQMAEMSLNGTVKLDYASSGLVWRLQSPICSVLEKNDHCNLESEKLTA